MPAPKWGSWLLDIASAKQVGGGHKCGVTAVWQHTIVVQKEGDLARTKARKACRLACPCSRNTAQGGFQSFRNSKQKSFSLKSSALSGWRSGGSCCVRTCKRKIYHSPGPAAWMYTSTAPHRLEGISSFLGPRGNTDWTQPCCSQEPRETSISPSKYVGAGSGGQKEELVNQPYNTSFRILSLWGCWAGPESALPVHSQA